MAHEISLSDDVFLKCKAYCVQVMKDKRVMPVDVMMMEMMDFPEIPIHFPYHHFMLPASLLTQAALCDGATVEELDDMLNVALERSKKVLGGFCGNFGACGAGVGAGIFLSVFTDTSPMSEKSWQWANEITGLSLQKISTIPGPRCCKRTCFLSLESAIPYINEKLDLKLTVSEKINCHYYEKNTECKLELCPYYPGK